MESNRGRAHKQKPMTTYMRTTLNRPVGRHGQFGGMGASHENVQWTGGVMEASSVQLFRKLVRVVTAFFFKVVLSLNLIGIACIENQV